MMWMMLLFNVSTAEVPVPKVLWQNERSRLWLVEQRRSDWLAIEDCRITHTDPTMLGALLREVLIPVAKKGLRMGVELRLSVGLNNLCMSWAGPRELVQSALDEGIGWPSARNFRREHRDSVLQALKIQRAAALSSLRVLHQAAEWWLMSGQVERHQSVPSLRQLRRSYRRICGDRRVSVVGAINPSDHGWLRHHFASSCWRRSSRHTRSAEIAVERGKVSIFPMETPNQAAFSLLVDASAHNWAERQLIASALDGLEGRLSSKLRAELGLVYAIGAKVSGQWIVINTTTSTENVSLVESAVLEVLGELPKRPFKESEQKRVLFASQGLRMSQLEDPQQIARVLNFYKEPNGWNESVAFKDQAYLVPLKSVSLQPTSLLWSGDVGLTELCYTLDECVVISSGDFTRELD